MKAKPNHQAAAALDHALEMLPFNHEPDQFINAVRLSGAPYGLDYQQAFANWIAVRDEKRRAKRRAELADQIEAAFYLFAPIVALAIWIFPTK